MSSRLLLLVSAWFLLFGSAAGAASFRTGKGTEDGFRISFRFRTDTPLGEKPELYPTLVVVIWKYEARKDGTPKRKSDFDEILTWEGKLDKSLVEEGVGFHFFTQAGRGEVRSLFYVSDIDAFRVSSAEAGATEDGERIAYTFLDDPEWLSRKNKMPRD